MIFRKKMQSATLIRRYKRFLADVLLEDQRILTVYCPNTGSMRSCSTPGSRVVFSASDNPLRKYAYTLEMIEEGDTWVGVNTSLTNQIVAEAIGNGEIAGFRDIDVVRAEVKTSAKTRLDFELLRGSTRIYVEVKNCSLVEHGVAMFPDAVTARGTKHLYELAELVAQGHEGVVFYLVQRQDARLFRPAAHIDPLYAGVLNEVHKKGVGIMVYQAAVSPAEIRVIGALPFELGSP